MPSFKNVNAPGVGEIDSRAVITAIFRWYKILSPNIELNIESIGTPPPSLTLIQWH